MATTTIRPKAIFIGVKEVYDALVSIRPDWDFEPCVETIDDLWTGLNDGTLDSNVQVLLALDIYFDPRGADPSFEKLIAQMAPYCLFGVINYRPENNELLSQRVESEAYSSGVGDVRYYLINHRSPAPSLDAAVAQFCSETSLRETAAILSGIDLSQDEEAEAIQEDPREAQLRNAIEESKASEGKYLGQVVAVTSSKGGSGKSTVAISLAAYLGHASANSVREGLEAEPLKVIILDIDVRDGQIGFLTNNTKPTVIQLRSKGISEQSLDETIIHSERLKCDLMLAPKRPRNADDTPPEFYVELIQALKQRYDYVILDTSVNYLDPLLEKVAYPISDQIIFVTDIVINSVFSMTRWIQEVTKPVSQMGMGIEKSKIGIVVNKSLSGVAMPGEKIYQSSLGIPILTPIPSNPKIMASAANTQQMDLLLKHQDIYAAIRRLARAVVGRKYKLSNSVEK